MTFGTRPEAIKLAPVIHALKQEPDQFDVVVCATAQHREMLDQVLECFAIVPDIDLNLMKHGQDLFDVTAEVLMGMRTVIRRINPHVLLVHGDTTTSFAAALAAYYEDVVVGHVEAGLRTYNLRAPFPEEFNRQTVSKLSRWHFAPTEQSRRNLLAERVNPENVTVTGNTVIDALFWVLQRLEKDDSRRRAIQALLEAAVGFEIEQTRYVLVTAHRRENFGDGINQLCEALAELAKRYPEVHFVYPVHFNPNIREPVMRLLSGLSNIHLIAPLDYEPFVLLLKHCFFVLTDSGGLQEEAPSLGKPVLVMREVTERPEAIEAGTVRLVGINTERVIASCSDLIENELSRNAMRASANPYGDGTASAQIVTTLRSVSRAE